MATKSIGSRHHQLWDVFGAGGQAWHFFNKKISYDALCKIVRFIGVQHNYFYSKKTCCALCNAPGPATLKHLLIECQAMTEVC